MLLSMDEYNLLKLLNYFVIENVNDEDYEVFVDYCGWHYF